MLCYSNGTDKNLLFYFCRQVTFPHAIVHCYSEELDVYKYFQFSPATPTRLSCRVESRRRRSLCELSCRRLPTISMENLETEQVSNLSNVTVCENCRDPVFNSNRSVSSAKTIRWRHNRKLGHDCSDWLSWVATRRRFNSHAATRLNSTVESRRVAGVNKFPALLGHWSQFDSDGAIQLLSFDE